MSEPSFKWFAAVGWGSENHQVCVLDAEGRVAGEREFPVSWSNRHQKYICGREHVVYYPDLYYFWRRW